MTTTNSNFEKISFWQLLGRTSVAIPIIQRDYAQGRKEQEKVRTRFLDALYQALQSKPIELDFVYGSEEKHCLHPLDGQQRLTTLFLLHWFAATKDGKLDASAKEQLKKFTYETRTSAREFCFALVENAASAELQDKSISEKIKNAAWFVTSWLRDATISAMLTMLDAIEKKFSDVNSLWDKLIAEPAPITFLYLQLENFGLSDDLYIKMNARGKALTGFEHFKAQFEKRIEDEAFETAPKLEESFAFKMDTIWTDLFWEYRNSNNLVDDAFMQFITQIAITSYATKNTTADAHHIQKLANGEATVVPEDFDQKAFDSLKEVLNKYADNSNDTTKSGITFWEDSKEEPKTFFEELVGETKISFSDRVLFFAQTEFLLKNNPIKQFDDWMRVVRNIVENIEINNSEKFSGAIKLVAELAEGSSDIYKWLSEDPTIKSNFAKEQMAEELAKAKLISHQPNIQGLIHKIEDLEFCKGKIGFVLYCAGYEIGKSQPENFNEEIQNKLNAFHQIISEWEPDGSIPSDFKRAFLTIGNNDYYKHITSWSYSFKCNKGALLKQYNDLKTGGFTKNVQAGEIEKPLDYLKALLEKRLEKGDYEKICEDFQIPADMPKWKARLIKESELMQHASLILLPPADTNSHCWLSTQQRPKPKQTPLQAWQIK